MQRILPQWAKSFLSLSLIVLTSLCSLLISFQQPSYALTTAGKLTPDEKIDRAYQMSEATGFLEEDKQNSANADKTFNYNDKANEKTVLNSDAKDEQTSLIEKAQELIKGAIGND